MALVSGALAAAVISEQKWLLYSWIVSLPASYVAMEAGWIVREVGRQPWTIYRLVRTAHSASQLPLPAVEASLFFFRGCVFGVICDLSRICTLPHRQGTGFSKTGRDFAGHGRKTAG